jgi:predicted glycogen debranching enzyme
MTADAAGEHVEWLEADGLGGFASGTAAGIRTRRYHAALLAAATPPTGRQVLVAGVEAHVETAAGSFALSSHRYAPDVVHPDGAARIAAYVCDPWPRWEFVLGTGMRVEHSILVPRGLPMVVIRWRAIDRAAAGRLIVRPLLAGRDYHALQRENDAFRFAPDREGELLIWRPYDGGQPIAALSNGAYEHAPDWYRNFLYSAERDRGLDHVEDLACPGTIAVDLSQRDAVLILAAGTGNALEQLRRQEALDLADRIASSERARRASLGDALMQAADAYVVRRGSGATLVAGYPWFTDWGRDTFIAMRGLCLATRRFDLARQILLEWSGAVSEGMLPNRFPDAGEAPEFNAVDASLWFVVAAHEWLEADRDAGPADRRAVEAAIEAILDGYARGTRFGIRADADGLLAAGTPGLQLTWMDARVGDQVVTPRIGKPVEVQALWINALWAASRFSSHWTASFERALAAFQGRFWNESRGMLFDVVDADHEPGRDDAAFRPNQVFAIGGLPLVLLDVQRARQVVDAVEAHLVTPLGLRSLAPGEPGYVGRYAGDAASRDGAYHQGTVWPWLMGPFVEAWVRVRGNTAAVRRAARARFLTPLLAAAGGEGPAHLPEVADGDAPHRPGGCPFQAWSVGEALRLDRSVLGARTTARHAARRPASKHPVAAR